MSRRVLIIADSRGYKLQDVLNEYIDFDFKISYHRGAKIEDACLLSLRDLYSHKPDIIILMAGICQVTKKINRNKHELMFNSETRVINDYV